MTSSTRGHVVGQLGERDLGVSRGHDEDQVDAEETLLDDGSAWSQIQHRRGPTLGGSSATVAPCVAVPASANAVDCAGGMQRWPARQYGAHA